MRARWRLFGRCAVALVWLYEGLWCMVLAGCPAQLAIVRSLPRPRGAVGPTLLVAIGAGETALALWVLCGWKARAAAWTQTLLLIAMNGAGLTWARSSIAEPINVIVHNLVLLTLA